ncbi:hypothetical protein YPPY11_4315, partial [Yersinia pestis PY-11]
MPSLRGT